MHCSSISNLLNLKKWVSTTYLFFLRYYICAAIQLLCITLKLYLKSFLVFLYQLLCDFLTQKNTKFFWLKYICSISFMHDAIYYITYIPIYFAIPMTKKWSMIIFHTMGHRCWIYFFYTSEKVTTPYFRYNKCIYNGGVDIGFYRNIRGGYIFSVV